MSLLLSYTERYRQRWEGEEKHFSLMFCAHFLFMWEERSLFGVQCWAFTYVNDFILHHIISCHTDCNCIVFCPWFQAITIVPGYGNKSNKTPSGLSSLVRQMTLLFHSASSNKLQKGRLLSFTSSLIKDTLCQWHFLNSLTNCWASYSKAEVSVCLLVTINIIVIFLRNEN